MTEYLRTENISVGYGKKAVVEDISLNVRRGEIMTLIGPNGSGKSTLLKSLIRQLKLLCGAVYLDQKSMSQMTNLELARKMSILMTQTIRPERMTSWDVVSSGRYPYTGRLGILSKEDREKVVQALELVNAQELAECAFSQLSDGQRQRILLARALCQEPKLLVLDEPTSFLDIRCKLELLSILKDMASQQQLAVVMSLHELELAQKISDYVVCIHNGTVERQGKPEEIFRSDYIMQLYDAKQGSYNTEFGSLELERVQGVPEIFVIGGAGQGIPIYRQLQRRGTPFAAGVLHENDLDYPVAKALAVEVVTQCAFEPIGPEAFLQAKEWVQKCRHVLCCLKEFGSMNEKNRQLMLYAQKAGKLITSPP